MQNVVVGQCCYSDSILFCTFQTVTGVRVFGENNKNVELENEVLNEDAVDCDEYVDLTAARISGLAPSEGSCD